jgi:hypothetical protein
VPSRQQGVPPPERRAAEQGEALRALRRSLFFTQQGQVRRCPPEDKGNQATYLNFVTNAETAWGTVSTGR